jgi:MFS family permease
MLNPATTPSRPLKRWALLRERNLLFYLLGQLPSLAGTFLQMTAQSWLVYSISRSAYWVGINAFLFYLPVTLLAPIGGAIIDRWDVRNVLKVTQTSAMLLAFALGWITLRHLPPLWLVNTFALLLGVINAVDNPGRSSLIGEIVKAEHLRKANSLNSGLYQLSVLGGPALAAYLIPKIGVGWTFMVNGVSFWGVIAALFLIRPDHSAKKCDDHPLAAIGEGIRWILPNAFIRSILLLAGTTLLLGYSFRTILPVVAVEVYHDGPRVFGLLAAAAAGGAMTGAFACLWIAHRWKISAGTLIGAGYLVIAAGLLAFSQTHRLAWGLAELFISGAGLMIAYPIIQSELQNHAPSDKRGRVISWSATMMFGGMMIGGLANGSLAQRFGTQTTLAMSGIAALVLGVVIFTQRRWLELPRGGE